MEGKAPSLTTMSPARRAAYEALMERLEELRRSGFREFKVRELGGEFVVAGIGREHATLRRKGNTGQLRSSIKP